ncbi:MAG: hypothetical protein KAJ75_03690 [Alphaproteobacteria bacterium]|nr:hypothetical protein [Alphaproteobacteria bacterium]
MIVSEIITKLKAISDSPLKKVGGALEFAGIQSQPPAPAAFVIPASENAGENRRTNGVSQKVATLFSVVLILKTTNDKSGLSAESSLEEIRGKIREQLLGWQPTNEHTDIEFVRGELVDIQAGRVFWRDEFKTEYLLTA